MNTKDKCIDVAMVTWPNHPKRLEYFQRMWGTLEENLSAVGHTLRFFCSAETERDQRREWCGHGLQELCDENDISLTWRDGPANLGANMNAALALCTAPVVLLQQDDWRLIHQLDLSAGAQYLLENPRVDLLRYSWPEDPKMLPTFTDHRDGWRRIDVNGLWPYGDDPHLRRPDFMIRYGWYYEGGGHGSASATMLRFLRRKGAVIAAANQCYYKHFGEVTSVIDDKRKRRAPR